MIVIASIWPENSHLEETISTLRFASRLSKVTNCPQKNFHLDQSLLLKRYEREIKDLKAELAMHDTLAGRGRIFYETYSAEQQYEQQILAQKFLSNEVEDIDIESIRQVKELFFQFKNLYKGISVDRKQGIDNLSEEKIRKILTKKSFEELKNNEENKNRVGQEEFTNGFGIGTANFECPPRNDQEALLRSRLLNNETNKKANTKSYRKENVGKNETLDEKVKAKLLNMSSKDFNEEEIFVDGKLNKQAIFETFKENTGKPLVSEIKSFIDEIKSCKEKFDTEKVTCENLKIKIDQLKAIAELSERNAVENLENDEVEPLHALKSMKLKYRERYENYVYFKKHLKELERKLIMKKKELLDEFNNILKKNFSINLDYFDNAINQNTLSSDQIPMNTEEELFDRTRQKFETLTKAKKMEKMYLNRN